MLNNEFHYNLIKCQSRFVDTWTGKNWMLVQCDNELFYTQEADDDDGDDDDDDDDDDDGDDVDDDVSFSWHKIWSI